MARHIQQVAKRGPILLRFPVLVSIRMSASCDRWSPKNSFGYEERVKNNAARDAIVTLFCVSLIGTALTAGLMYLTGLDVLFGFDFKKPKDFSEQHPARPME